ncbi:MAG: NADH-quinone oxidoreductase subunit C, partial [Thermoanaerobaculia bacterium]|nr:NADH-quinone oxidoreductase subunit C [Thermoanaerobaculia bacterium]
MSTMTRFSSVPYTGPAPTNIEPYVPRNVDAINARAEEIETKISAPWITRQPDQDMPTFQVEREKIVEALTTLRDEPELEFKLPLDLFGVDYPKRESGRFDVVYQLHSFKNNEKVRLKVRTDEETPVPSSLPAFKGFDWFEREAYDMYGIRFDGHYDLRRILCHEAFQGHALRKDYDPAQRWILTEKDVATLKPRVPELPEDSDFEYVTLNLGPSHPATHGTLRIAVTLDGETIVGADTEIGYLHRCFEKMSETHTYQQVIPFTDRL